MNGTCSLTLRGHGYWVFENKVLRRIFGLQWSEMVRGWGNVDNGELHNLYSSPNITRLMKSRRMRWAGHEARMERKETHIGFWWEN
jgi:hypothetical protein